MAQNRSRGFSEVECAAMKERAAELRAEKGGRKVATALEVLLKSIQAMPADQRAIAERVHVIVTEVAPDLLPKTWYGQPAWTNADGKVVVFFHSAAKYGIPATTAWGSRRLLTSTTGSCGRRRTRSPALSTSARRSRSLTSCGRLPA